MKVHSVYTMNADSAVILHLGCTSSPFIAVAQPED